MVLCMAPIGNLAFPGLERCAGRASNLPQAYGLWRYRFDFTEKAAADVVDESADGDRFGNPWVRVQLLQLMAYIFIYVLECVEESGSKCGGAGGILDSGAQILFIRMHQSAIGVIDDHDFLDTEQVVRHEQRAQRVVRDDAAGIANDVRVSGF